MLRSSPPARSIYGFYSTLLLTEGIRRSMSLLAASFLGLITLRIQTHSCFQGCIILMHSRKKVSNSRIVLSSARCALRSFSHCLLLMDPV
jgi:hypothetical protein